MITELTSKVKKPVNLGLVFFLLSSKVSWREKHGKFKVEETSRRPFRMLRLCKK